MKVTVRNVMEKNAALAEVARLRLPRKASYAIAKNIMRFRRELELCQKQREDIAKLYAKKDACGRPKVEKGVYVFDTDKNKDAFIRESEELMDVEVEIPVMRFRAEELDRCDEVNRYDVMSPAQEAGIEWMIDYGEEANEDIKV